MRLFGEHAFKPCVRVSATMSTHPSASVCFRSCSCRTSTSSFSAPIKWSASSACYFPDDLWIVSAIAPCLDSGPYIVSSSGEPPSTHATETLARRLK